jgi:hypothetical protein
LNQKRAVPDAWIRAEQLVRAESLILSAEPEGRSTGDVESVSGIVSSAA